MVLNAAGVWRMWFSSSQWVQGRALAEDQKNYIFSARKAVDWLSIS